MDFNKWIGILIFEFLLLEFSNSRTQGSLSQPANTGAIIATEPRDISVIPVLPIVERLRSRKGPSSKIIRHSDRASKLLHKEKQREKYYTLPTVTDYGNRPLKRQPISHPSQSASHKLKCFRFKDGAYRQYSERFCGLKIPPTTKSNDRNQHPTTSPSVNKYIRNIIYSYNPNMEEGYNTNLRSPIGYPSIHDNTKSNLSRLLLEFHSKEVHNENYPHNDIRLKNVDLSNRQSKSKSRRLLEDREMATTDFEITYSPSLEIRDLSKSDLSNFNTQQSGKFAEPPVYLKINSSTYLPDNRPTTLSMQVSKNYQRNYLSPLNQSSTMDYLQYSEFTSNDTSSTHSGTFPLDPNHQQPSYKFGKSSYEVPVYGKVHLDSSNNEIENYSNFLYDQSTATKASSDQIEPFKIVPCHYTKNEEIENIQQRQNLAPHITDILVHILDSPELKEAFEANERRKTVSSGSTSERYEYAE